MPLATVAAAMLPDPSTVRRVSGNGSVCGFGRNIV
jgi:hypothetical protein